MMMLAGVSPSPVQVPTSAVPPPGVPPTAPPSPPTTPPAAKPITGVSSSFVTDLTEASRLASKAVEMLATVPLDDVGSESTKDLRIRIFKTSMAAQKRLEKQLESGNPESVVSELRKADAYLEDANWQLAKKPSPDGRFNGVDIPGAVRDTAEGARIINELLAGAGGMPAEPTTPPPVDPPVHPPSGPTPPSGPPSPPTPPPTWPPAPGGGGGTDPDLPPAPPTDPDLPPAPPSGPSGPGQGSPDPDYPGEDEFPKDEDILKGDG